jgi:hypothetical protein
MGRDACGGSSIDGQSLKSTLRVFRFRVSELFSLLLPCEAVTGLFGTIVGYIFGVASTRTAKPNGQAGEAVGGQGGQQANDSKAGKGGKQS